MTLGDLVSRLTDVRLEGPTGVAVDGITHDSRLVRPGWIFAACPGQAQHGLDFVTEARSRGAIAVLSDRRPAAEVGLPWISAPLPRRAMAEAAWVLAGDPQHDLLMIGVTGTNGKSTTAHLTSLILEAGGTRAGFLGTLGYRLATTAIAGQRTTPEATDLAPMLRQLRSEGGQAAVMEVSSHALQLDRLHGLAFDVAVWTNLSRDHLDFHGDMESYFAAKRRLFDAHLTRDGRRVLAAEDPWAARLLAQPRPGDLSWGIDRGDVHAVKPQRSLDGTTFTLEAAGARLPVHLPLLGDHNLRNALAAAAATLAAGIELAAIGHGLEGAAPLPGRLEPVPGASPATVLIDYAHTPEALRSVLSALRQLSDRTLIVVVGAGGDRDRGKREPMGEAVGQLADVIIVTSDNPRSEDPAEIAAALAAGVRRAGAEPTVILDRRAAIRAALEQADEHSLVVVAGKGHEEVQIIGQRQIPFSDREVISELASGGRGN